MPRKRLPLAGRAKSEAKLCLVRLLTLKARQVLRWLNLRLAQSLRSGKASVPTTNEPSVDSQLCLRSKESTASDELHCKRGLFALRASTWLGTAIKATLGTLRKAMQSNEPQCPRLEPWGRAQPVIARLGVLKAWQSACSRHPNLADGCWRWCPIATGHSL